MNERDFDIGYKSGFQFGEEVANEEWLNKVKWARKEIENIAWKSRTSKVVDGNRIKTELINRADVLEILDNLIAESEN